MKKSQKLLLIALSIFVLCTAGLTIWYFSLHYLTEKNGENIIKAILNIGLIGAILPSILIFLIYYLAKKSMNKSSKIFLIIILSLFLLFSIYNITLIMMFYELEESKSFLQSLLEVF
jgi:mannose/fructose/N-acetylgalactosamine-specific phosphotransferase system component IID